MKNSKKALILLLILASSVSMAKGKKKRQEKPSKPYKYYYTLPVEASLTEWAYTVPECQSVSKDEYKFVDRTENCQENAELKTRNCLSRIDVELKNTKTNQKKTFGLNYIIHDTMKNCQESHAKLVPPAPASKPELGTETASEQKN